MVPSAHPGCCGTAARLPNNPGSQKLTPPSSARVLFVASTMATIAKNAIARSDLHPDRPNKRCLPVAAKTDLTKSFGSISTPRGSLTLPLKANSVARMRLTERDAHSSGTVAEFHAAGTDLEMVWLTKHSIRLIAHGIVPLKPY